MLHYIWWSLPLTLVVFFAARKLGARFKMPLLNPLLVSMVVAAVTVHWANGFFITNNGFEYAMILGLISAVLIIEGAGKLSLDRAIAR